MRTALFFVLALGALSLGGASITGCGDGGTGGSGGSGGSGGTGGTGGSGGSGGTGGDLTVEGTCASLAKALCSHVQTCAPFVFDVTYGDPTTCQQRSAARCAEGPKLDGSNVTPEVILACAGAYAERTCEDVFAGAPAACRVPGDRPDGAACATAGQCQGSLCETPGEGQCGTCATILKQGAGCNPAKDRCDSGLFCSDATSTCQPYSALGQACSVDALCKAGLSCNGGTCGPLVQEGGDCSLGQACDIKVGALCSLDGNCHTLQVAKLGEACGYDSATGDVAICEIDTRCGPTQVCVPRPKAGEACEVNPDTGNGNCITGLDCVAGKCQAAYPVCN